MAKNFKNETSLSNRSAPKRLIFKGNGKLNEWKANIFFILVLVPVYADIKFDTEHVVRPHALEDFLRFEIIKPTLQHGRNSRVIYDTRLEDGSHAEELVLHYALDGKDVIVDLRLNQNLVPHNHFIRYQLPNGTDAVQYFTKTDVDLCHYRGAIRNNTASYVAISTCYGIKGMIFDGNETYYIDTKLSGNVSDAHYLFRHSDRKENQSNNPTCGHESEATEPSISFNDDSAIRHKYKRSTGRIIEGQPSYVEFVLVVDHSIYKNLGSDIKKIHHYCKDIANVVNALYVPLNIFIILVGVSIWNEKDRIRLSSDSDATLEYFLQHRRDVLMKEHPNDNAHLLTNQKFEGNVIGHAIFNSICTLSHSGGLTSRHSHSTSIVASTVAHELGHNFGMRHDSEGCTCEKEPCIMANSKANDAEAYSWSSCSKNELKLTFDGGLLQCLRNKPADLLNSALCGNGFVEPGEQCDCGPAEFCENTCCNAKTCMFRQNASCASGECCDLTTCRPHGMGTLCRRSIGDCDIPDYCTGESEHCPDDAFKRDTELCGGGKAYCYGGACKSHNDQCKLLWGKNGISIRECYENNLFGNVSGNCGKGLIEHSLKKCSAEDMMCGQLQCNEIRDTALEKHARAKVKRTFSLRFPYYECQTAIADVGLYNVDPGMTPNGAMCGDGKMCIHQKCVSVEKLRVEGTGVDCPGNCSGHGICDNKRRCHCDSGYLPPLCDIGYLPPLCDINGPAFNSINSLNDGQRFVRIMLIGMLPIFFTLQLLLS